jgi:hypothetical protein
MPETKQLRKHALECLRLEADCMELAKVVCGGNLRSHFVAMARFWGDLAVSGPNSNAGPEFFKAEIPTT